MNSKDFGKPSEDSKSRDNSRMESKDEMKHRFQLSTNEIGELKNSLYYVESRLEKELDG